MKNELGCVVAWMLALVAGCSAPARIAAEPTTQVIAVAAVAEAPEEAAGPTEPEVPVVDPSIQAFIGVWEDPETANYTRFTIDIDGYVPVVQSAIESRGEHEVFEVRSSTWQDGVLTWIYYVPSTQYVVTFKTTEVKEKTMEFTWSNSAGDSGTGELNKVDPSVPVEEEP